MLFESYLLLVMACGSVDRRANRPVSARAKKSPARPRANRGLPAGWTKISILKKKCLDMQFVFLKDSKANKYS